MISTRAQRGVPAGTSPYRLRQWRGEALAELIRVGFAHIGMPDDTSGADRYTLNITANFTDLTGHRCEQPTLGAEPISIETATRIACDCAVVRHVVAGGGEILDVGRKTRVWDRAQRRAIRRRDRNRCRFPGCHNRIFDVSPIPYVPSEPGARSVLGGERPRPGERCGSDRGVGVDRGRGGGLGAAGGGPLG